MKFYFFALIISLSSSAIHAEIPCTPAGPFAVCKGSYPTVCARPCSGGFSYQFMNGLNCDIKGTAKVGTCYGGFFEKGPLPLRKGVPDSPPSCNDVEEEVDTVKNIMASANGKNMSMTNFLKSLPDDLRTNFIFMGQSQSLQTATATNPRVIMTSARGDVRVSFNTSPNERGYNKVEISTWNPHKQAFDYQEMEFNTQDGKAQQHKDPSSCVQCHGNPAKPNWDNYNYWAGAIPTNKDTLVPNSKEAKEYLNLIKRAESAPANDPMSALLLARPSPGRDRTSVRIAQELENGKLVQLDPMTREGITFPGSAGGVGVVIFDRLVSRSGCMARRELREQVPNPEAFKSLKYILLGLRNNCQNMDQFVPEWFLNLAEKRFADIRGMGKNAEGDDKNKMNFSEGLSPKNNLEKSIMDDIIVDTDIRQKRVVLDKIGRQMNFHIETYLKSGQAKNLEEAKKMAIAEMELNRAKLGLNIVGVRPGQGNPVNPYYDAPTEGKSESYRYRYQNNQPIVTINESTTRVAQYRYFLEPFGVKMNRWSPTIDETSYSFSDLFNNVESNLLSQDDIEAIGRELESNPTCERLAKASKDSFSGDNNSVKKIAEDFVEKRCQTLIVTDDNPIEILSELSDDILKKQIKDIFQTCSTCHRDDTGRGYTSKGPPVILFDDLSKLEVELKKMPGSPTNLGYKVWERVQRHPNTIGAMPMQMGSLSKEELQYVKTYLHRLNIFKK